MLTRVLHISDLHFGRNVEPEPIEALARLISEVQPELVIASGDLTHRGLRSQHDLAAEFLRGLELPLLAVPGNHDIPYTFPKRFTNPWLEFERQWETTQPVYSSETLAVAGLNSVRPWRHQSGKVRAAAGRAREGGVRGRAARGTQDRRPPPPPPRRALALAKEARRRTETASSAASWKRGRS